MNRHLNEIHLRRGRLLERIAAQRADLGRDLRPIRNSLSRIDRVVGRLRAITDYVKRHPSITALAMAGLFAIRKEGAWRWTKRAFLAWRAWRAFGEKLSLLGSRIS
ncbi:MAG: YqjK-like family protein [Propionivibrio sp.]